MGTRNRRLGGRTADVSRRIFEATIGLLVEGGFPAVTFQAVAQRAEVGRATLYRRWRSPTELVADAVSASAAEQIIIDDTGSLRGDLAHILRQIAAFISGPIGLAALSAALHLHQLTAVRDTSTRWGKRWADIAPVFARARARGELNGEVDAEAVFARLAGALYFRLLVIGRAPDDDWITRILEGTRRI